METRVLVPPHELELLRKKAQANDDYVTAIRSLRSIADQLQAEGNAGAVDPRFVAGYVRAFTDMATEIVRASRIHLDEQVPVHNHQPNSTSPCRLCVEMAENQ